MDLCRIAVDPQCAQRWQGRLPRISQGLHGAGIIRDLQEDESISRRHNHVQGVAAHAGRRKPGWLAKGAFGTRLFPWGVQWRGCDRQGLEALCRHRGVGILQFQSFEPKAPTAKVKPREECAFCHIASAKKDEVWTQFYRLLDY